MLSYNSLTEIPYSKIRCLIHDKGHQNLSLVLFNHTFNIRHTFRNSGLRSLLSLESKGKSVTRQGAWPCVDLSRAS